MGGLRTAIEKYEEGMVACGKAEVDFSLKAMYLAHDLKKLIDSPVLKLAGQKLSEAGIM